MRRSILFLVAVSLLAAAIPAAQAASETRRHYIVVLSDSANSSNVAAEHAQRYGATVSHVYRNALRGYAAAMSDRAATEIAGDRRVRLVQPDQMVQATGAVPASVPTGIHRTFAAHNAGIDIDGSDDNRVDVDVAIIDSGIDLDHPDLNVAGGKNCQTGSSADDGDGHGTHVAGTVGGLDNGRGAVGMAPGARLWAVRVLDNNGSGSWSAVICGVDWVTGRNTDSDATNNIEVANMSLGGTGTEPADPDFDCVTGSSLHDAICKSVSAGTTYAVAAGNSSADSAGHVPAAYNEVMTVSALADFDGEPGGLGAATCRSDVDETFANFSNYGVDVDLIAPGVCIKSTWKGGGYNTISGTSMASPHVAGAAALYKSSHPDASPTTVKGALVGAGNLNWTNADDKDSTKERLLDVSSANFNPAFLSSTAPPPPNATPTVNVDSPTTGSTVSGTTVSVSASASDSDGTVSKVDFYIDNATVPFGTDSDSAGGWTAIWDSTSVADGGHTIKAVATDNGGATGSGSVTVTVDNVADPQPGAALAVAVSAGTSVKKGQWYSVALTATVTDGTNAVSGATVGLDVLNGVCPGTTSAGSGSGTTDVNGVVTFNFKSRTRSPYCAKVTAAKDGYASGSGSTDFST